MSKPSFKMPSRPEPASTSVDQWVAGREDTTALESTGRPEKPTGKLARLTIDLPPDLHARFKATCALKSTRMIDEVRRFIEGWTETNRP
jgi:hypothetical protein